MIICLFFFNLTFWKTGYKSNFLFYLLWNMTLIFYLLIFHFQRQVTKIISCFICEKKWHWFFFFNLLFWKCKKNILLIYTKYISEGKCFWLEECTKLNNSLQYMKLFSDSIILWCEWWIYQNAYATISEEFMIETMALF